MAVQMSQREGQALPLWRPDDQEYWTMYNGSPVKMFWSEMTRRQKQLQLEAERRQAEIDAFRIYS